MFDWFNPPNAPTIKPETINIINIFLLIIKCVNIKNNTILGTTDNRIILSIFNPKKISGK